MADNVRCSKGHENTAGDNFCRFCGEKISGGQMRCPGCGATIDSAAQFCGRCGKPVSGDRDKDPTFDGMIWRRGDNDFATRIDVDDLPGIIRKGIIVEQGTKALLFINGALAETLMPGRYMVGGLADKLKHLQIHRTAIVVLLDVGDVEIPLTIADVYTKDPLKIDVTCKVVLQMENPLFFFNNVLKGRDSYPISELRASLYDEINGAFNEVVGKKSVSELNWDISLKRQFEVFVENHLRTTLQRTGLSLIQLRTLDYRFEGYDKLRRTREEIFLLVSEEEAKLQRRKRLFDVYDQTQIQDIAEETKEVQYREQRQKLWAEMRKLVNSDKMNEIKSADDLETYIHEIDKGKLLREEEVKDLKDSFAQSGMRRDFLLQKIQLEQNLERERIGLVGHAENDLAAWEVRAKKARRELDENIKAQKDLKGAEREIKVEGARADATVKDLERDGDEKDLDMGLAALERIKKIKEAEKRADMDIEVTRLERLSQLGIEALISASDADQARMLKDLKQTEILKGMTEEQILAMGAKDSPELAKAFQEKFKGMSAAEQEKLYREMMAQKDTSMKVMQQMFDKALETQRDATVGVAQGGRVTAVYPPPGQAGYYNVPGHGGYPPPAGGAGGTEVVVCQKCHSKVATGQKFCNNCGSEMF